MHPLGYRAALKLKDGELVTGKWHDEAYMRAGSPRDSEVEAYGFAKPGGKGFLSMDEVVKMLAERYALPVSPISPIPRQHFQEGGFVQGVEKFFGGQGATQPPQPPAAPSPSAGGASVWQGMQAGGTQANIPSDVMRNVRVTHYGYEKPHPKNWDPNSAMGIGDRDNMLTYDPEGITSVALSPSYRLARFGRQRPSTGTVFQVGDRLFRDDDTTADKVKDHRIDIFDPNKEGTGFPDIVQVAEGADLGRNVPVPPHQSQ
jgi:hypothetical protein